MTNTATTPAWPGSIYGRYTDLVEPFGIDESWLDVTGTIHLFGGDPEALADRLRREMKEELGLTISVGVSFNKVFAKLGSDYKKPDATTVITPSGCAPAGVAPAGDRPALCGPGHRRGLGEPGHPHHWGPGPG